METIKYAVLTKPAKGISIGYIHGFLGDNAPADWVLCEGQVLSQDDYPELFEIIGTTYNKKYTVKNPDRRWYNIRTPRFIEIQEQVPGLFRLPDLRAKVVV